jgi:tetratricopeptide (TPR) repeat protein
MYIVKSILQTGLCAFIIAAFPGFASAQSNMATAPLESLRQGYDVVYHPKMQPGQTRNTVYQDLRSEFKSHHFGGSYVKDPTLDYTPNPNLKNSWLGISSCTVDDNRITLTTIYVYIGYPPIAATLFNYHLLKPALAVGKSNIDRNIPYEIRLGDSFSFGFKDLSSAQKVADALFFIQQQLKEIEDERNKKLTSFEPIAAQYRALTVKPPAPEEQRRFVVQANAMNQQKNYARAIEQYLKVIELDPVSYPGAYFNLALLSAQENDPLSAVFYMKQYLMLVPEAQDARSAQDKIYEWEFMLNK